MGIIKNFSNVTLIHLLSEAKGEKRKKVGTQVNKLGKKILRKLSNLRMGEQIYPIEYKDIDCEKIQFPATEINTDKGIALIKSLRPDVLFTVQAPILKELIFQIPKLAAINTHYGIAPHYRGNYTLFWAMYYQDYEHLGGCFHYITKGVDAGGILAEVRPKIGKADGEVTLQNKTTLLLAKSAPKILEIIQKSAVLPKGKIQVEKGRNYKYSERTLSAEIKFLIRRILISRKLTHEHEKIELFV
jgi:methionyl-tRNA formyltransferase